MSDKKEKKVEEIIFVTHNKGKMASAQKRLQDVKFSIYEYELEEPRSDDISFISEAKVKQAYELVHKPCISLDCGFFIKELNGFPRAFVNFALDTIGIKGILKLMDGIKDRTCFFGECLSYYDGKELKQFMGHHEGSLAKEKLGEDTDKKWSELWYIFIPKNYAKTLAQMTQEERDLRDQTKKDESIDSMTSFAKWYLEKKKEGRK